MSPERIAGRYRVERAAGHGGMGTVWLCHDEVLGREVAVKQVGVLPGESVPDLARAMREARSSAGLHHPHVVSVYDAIEADDHIWLVMEYVPGSTLAELIRTEGRLDPVRVAHIGAQVADGLAAAHARGTIHRDVKPGNVLVSEGDVAKVSDFGIARTEGDEQLTRSGLLIGTPTYFSPEIARGADPSPSSDVWALGATLFHAVEGRPLVADRGNPIVTLAAIAEVTPAPPEHAEFLTGPILRMLDPDPAARWSMADAAHSLRRLYLRHRAATLGWAAAGSGEASTVAWARTGTPGGGAAPGPTEPPGGWAGAADGADQEEDDHVVAAAAAAPAATAATAATADHEPPGDGPDDRDDRDGGHEGRRRRWGPALVAVLVVALLAVIGLAVLLDRGDPTADAGDRTGAGADASTGPTRHPSKHRPRSPKASPSDTAAPTASTTPTPTTAATTPSTPASSSTSEPPPGPAAGATGAQQAVVSYYGLLPGDTQDAWAMLGPTARASAGGYGGYRGFWNTIDSVQVGATSIQGDVVSVQLTYNGNDSETRRLRVDQEGGRWMITEDLGAG